MGKSDNKIKPLAFHAYDKLTEKVDSNTPESVSAMQAAEQALAARQATDPASQALAFKLASDPTSGMGAYTKLAYDTRAGVYGQEDALKNAFLQDLIAGFKSDYSVPNRVEEGVLRQREIARNNLTEALRTRANLGGGLYGGRAAEEESRAISNLESGFAEQDYNNLIANRQMQLQAALSGLGLLYPQVGVGSTPFESAVPSGSAVYQGQMQQNQFNAQMRAQEAAAKQQQQMQLAMMLGSIAAAPATGGMSLAAIPGTMGNTGRTQSQILGYNTAQYR